MNASLTQIGLHNFRINGSDKVGNMVIELECGTVECDRFMEVINGPYDSCGCGSYNTDKMAQAYSDMLDEQVRRVLRLDNPKSQYKWEALGRETVGPPFHWQDRVIGSKDICVPVWPFKNTKQI